MALIAQNVGNLLLTKVYTTGTLFRVLGHPDPGGSRSFATAAQGPDGGC